MKKNLTGVCTIVVLVTVLVTACTVRGPAQIQDLSTIEEEFRYHLDGAGEVTLVWGINGWGKAPPGLIQPGTNIENDLMHTPMTKEGEVFVARVRVPAWSNIDYGFLITKLADGSAIAPVWDGGEDYTKQVTEQNATIEVQARVELPQPSTVLALDPESIVEQEFRYQMPEAGEVTLVWGINGWGLVPEAIRPPGTEIVNDVMHTPMKKEKDVFSVVVAVPAGSRVDYGFLITKRATGEAIEPVWEGGDGFNLTVDRLGQPVETISTLALASAKLAVDIRPENILPVEIRYRAPDAEQVILVWGIDGWQTLPEESLPAGTWIENKVMKTAMIHEGDVFHVTVQVPKSSTIEYGFLLSKTQAGATTNIWDGGLDDSYRALVIEPATLEVSSAIKIENPKSMPSTLVVGGYIFIGIVLIALVGFIFRKK